ncbi:MFS transporter [Zafaria sp. Z1313]|uniref:MFS transporter n=1 Tax=unclassified Zafaria TaxID=2828765 RepID=UPI002E775670|nr:MFS transporter [Zafaria sp. J156]MEE1620651.1 MFS transporter [Zafaria sp. J156]
MQSSTPLQTPPTGLAPWRNAIFVVFALSGVGFATWVSRIPAVRDDLELSTSTIGLMLFGLAGGSIAGLAAAPAFLARFGAARGLQVTLSTMAVSQIALGLSAGWLGSAALTAAVLVAFGFVYSITDVVMNIEGALVEKASRRTLLPLMHAFFSVGTILGALGGSAAAAAGVSVEVHFTALGLVIAAAGLLSCRHVPVAGSALRGPGSPAAAATAPRTWPGRMRSTLLLARDPHLVLIGLMVVGMAFAEGSANDWLALAAVDGHGFDNATGALVYGAFVAAMTLGRVAGGPLIDRFGRRTVLMAMAVLGIAGIAGFILAEDPVLAFAAVVLWGLGGSLGFPVGISVAADHPVDAARRVSIVSIFGYSAFLVGPPVLGFLGESYGLLAAFWFVAAMLLVSFAATPRATRPATTSRV